MQGFEVFETPEGQEMLEEAMEELSEVLETPEGQEMLEEALAELNDGAEDLFSTPARQELANGEALEKRADEIGILQVDEINKAPTMEVQAREIGEYFRETPELQYENWIELSVDERLEAMQAMENEAAEIAHRPAVPVQVKELEDNVFGYQNDDGLTLNTKYVMSDSREAYVETMNTVIHEGRHAYQMENIALAEAGSPVLEQNLEWVNSWRVNWLDMGYESGNFAFDGLGFERYYTQPLEVDARAFAAQAIHEMGLS